MNIPELLTKGKRYLTDGKYRIRVNAKKGFYNSIADEEYLKKIFYAHMGKSLDLRNPKTFNEKLQWLKLYDRKPEYTLMVDKYCVKKYIADTIGEEYVIPLLGVWDDPEEIDFSTLPNQFVLKCNHNSSKGLCICKDKSKLDIKKTKQALRKGLQQNYYLAAREWPYKNVPRKIFAEKYIEDSSGDGLCDYKIHNFNGVPKFILYTQNRFAKSGLTEDFFSVNWQHLDCKRLSHPGVSQLPPRPDKLDELLSLSQTLSSQIPHLRTDFYIVDEKIYFGELTFYPAAGLEPFFPEKWDYILGNWLILPVEK